MPVRAYWLDNNQKHAIVIEFAGDWTWDEYGTVRRSDLYPRLDTVDAPVPHIYDLSNTDTLPPDSLSRIRDVAASAHDNFDGDLTIVGAKPLLKAVINVAGELFLKRFKGIRIRFGDTLDDAERLLQAESKNKGSFSEKILDTLLLLVEQIDDLSPTKRHRLVILLVILYIVILGLTSTIGLQPPLLGLEAAAFLITLLFFTDIRYVLPFVLLFSGSFFVLPLLIPGIYTQQFVDNLWTLPLLFGFVGMIISIAVALIRRLRVQRDVAVLAVNELDVTREQLHKSEAMYRDLVENTGDVTFTIDAGGYFTYASPATEMLTGYTVDELLGVHFLKIVERSYRDEVLGYYLRQLQGKSSETVYEFPIYTRAGVQKWVEQRVTISYERQQTTIRAIVRDVSERKLMEQALQNARDEAIAAANFKSQILANISHDIRTPLNVISMVVDMISEGLYGEVNEEQRGKLQTVGTNVDSVMMLVRNLLDAARMEQGVIRLKIDDFTPQKLMSKVDASLRTLVRAKSLDWETYIDPALPEIMYGDMNRLQQMILNLGQNAIQFTDAGKIRLAFECVDDDTWTIKISDTGSGIPKDAQQHIFDAFWQVDDSFTRQVQEGVGLGLSIVRQLVDLMDGDIQLESAEGQGTTFTILLDLHREMPEAALYDDPEASLFLK